MDIVCRAAAICPLAGAAEARSTAPYNCSFDAVIRRFVRRITDIVVLKGFDDGVFGIRCSKSDSQVLADALYRWLCDRELKNALGQVGRKRVSRLRSERERFDGLINTYKCVLSRVPN